MIVGRHIQFTTDDGLPQNICLNCVLRIDQAFGFRRKCIEVDGTLRNLKSTGKNSIDHKSTNKTDNFPNCAISIADSDDFEPFEGFDNDPLSTSSNHKENNNNELECESIDYGEEQLFDEEEYLDRDEDNEEEDQENEEEDHGQEDCLSERESISDCLIEENTVTLDPSHQQIQIMIQGYPPDLNGLQQQLKAQMLPAGTVVAPIPMNPKQPDITINYDFIKKENMGLAYSSPNSLLSYTNQATNNPDVSI